MAENRDKPHSEADAELEREVHAGRTFSLAEAVGRMAGPGMMKGVSPGTHKQQAEAVIDDFHRRNLTDPGGVLWLVVFIRVSGSDLLLGDYDHPLAVLENYARQVLWSDTRYSTWPLPPHRLVRRMKRHRPASSPVKYGLIDPPAVRFQTGHDHPRTVFK